MAKILDHPMIGHCYFRTRMCAQLRDTYVATCDKEIADYISSIDGKVVMTSPNHNRASDRTAEAMLKIESNTGEPSDVVVMVQGDEPLLLPEMIGQLLEEFREPEVHIANLMSRIRTRKEFFSKNNVKVVVNQQRDAMYFSREPIPSPWKGSNDLPMLMQVGLIAFRRDALIQFNGTAETTLEKAESVDMNRVLEMGQRVRMVLTEAETIGVDTPEELEDVAKRMKNDALLRRYLK
jgi:3-deoxy-manno-octulosonate cytidylyltransferase (CMP-KDO synthetase)